GDAAPVLVAHSTSGLARAHLDQPDQAREPKAAALSRLLGLPPPESAFVHRWTFAKPADPREADYYLDEDLVGICGDGWTAKPRVEGAWRSGRVLGEAVRDRLA
ncbi:MAG: NAD/FAD-dependent oxidoreductase, partial [Actinomycetes bacterium]